MKTREARGIRGTDRGRASFNNKETWNAQNGASHRRRRTQKGQSDIDTSPHRSRLKGKRPR